jgi:peptidoglycan/LPS O-acetylase OafA/YrhL
MGKCFYSGRYTTNINGVINFWQNRIFRIFPLYFFSILISSIFVYPEILKFQNWGYFVRLFTFTFHPNVDIHTLSFNDALWSISTEVQFYLIVPFLHTFLSPKISNSKQTFTALILIIFGVAAIKLLPWLSIRTQIIHQGEYGFRYWYAPLLTNLDVFLCGFLVNPLIKYYRFNQSAFKQSRKKLFQFLSQFNLTLISIILLVVFYLFTAHHLYYQELMFLPGRFGGWRTSTTFFLLQPLTAIVTSFFIFAVESKAYNLHIYNEKLSFAAILRNPMRILEVMGILSYGVYVWHYPILNRITAIFTSNLPIEAFFLRFIATLILSALLATITYFTVEIPSSKWKKYRKSND